MRGNSYVPFMLRRGDGSRLSLDFASMGELDSRFTFSRASTATFINSSGLVESAANGVARFDHDPATLARRGLLIEGSATNLCIRSQEINTSNWTIGGNTTLTQNTSDVADPAGGNTATKIVFSANAYGSRAQQISVLGNTQYTFSFWIRGTPGNTSRIYSYAGFAGDLVTQTAYSYSTTGWTRVQTTFTTNASTTGIYVYLASKSTAVGSTDTIYVWGAQLEAGSGASSYIPTGASTVQRALDVCSMTGTNFSSWYTQGVGTVLVFSDINFPNTSQNVSFLIQDATAQNYARAGHKVGGGTAEALLTATSGSIQGFADTAFIPSNTIAYKTCYAWEANNFAAVANNGTVGTDTSGSPPGTVDRMFIGGDGLNSVHAKQGHIAKLVYWPTRLPNATMKALTA